MNEPTLQSQWDPKRGAVSYRVGKQGVKNLALYLSLDDLVQLRDLINRAIRADDDAEPPR